MLNENNTVPNFYPWQIISPVLLSRLISDLAYQERLSIRTEVPSNPQIEAIVMRKKLFEYLNYLQRLRPRFKWLLLTYLLMFAASLELVVSIACSEIDIQQLLLVPSVIVEAKVMIQLILVSTWSFSKLV